MDVKQYIVNEYSCYTLSIAVNVLFVGTNLSAEQKALEKTISTVRSSDERYSIVDR